MPRPLTEIEDLLAEVLEDLNSHLTDVDARWPALLDQLEGIGGGRVPHLLAKAELGADLIGHPLYLAYERLSSALAAVQDHNDTGIWAITESLEAQSLEDVPATAGPEEAETVRTVEPEPAETEPERSEPEHEDAEASVVIVGRSTDRRGSTRMAPVESPSQRPQSRSLRDRLGAVLGGGAGPEVPSDDRPQRAAETPQDATPAVSRNSEARASRLPAPPARRKRPGLWREEASVVIVRGPDGERSPEPEPGDNDGPGDR